MIVEKPKGTESPVSVDSKSDVRRKFLKRATAGAVIASIPGRSAWAAITGSIAASGTGSDFNSGICTQLMTAEEFVSSGYDNLRFVDIFPGAPFDSIGKQKSLHKPNDPGGLKSFRFKGILEPAAKKGAPPLTEDRLQNRRGVNDVNVALIVIYLNAINHRSANIHYNVLAQFENDSQKFANYLYNSISVDPGRGGIELSNFINEPNLLSCS